MFRNLIKNKKAQNTAEYALLIALVVAGIIAMQQYAQRALQARVRDASQFMTSQKFNESSTITTANQYEPYYMQSNYTVERDSEDRKDMGINLVTTNTSSNRTRQGSQTTTYNLDTGL